MKQAYLADAVSDVPASTGAASVGNPSDGDPANGLEATALGAYAMFQLFKELEAVIDEGGLTADVDTLTQVRDAIQAMIDASAGLDTTAGDARYLRRDQNLGDVDSAGSSRGNLNAAPVNSPTFTGNPKAPTPSVGDDDTSIATTAFVDEAIASIPGGLTLASDNEHLQNNPPGNEAATPRGVRAVRDALIDGAPATRDTLDELYDVLAAQIAGLVFPDGVALATQNEHLQANPPTNEAAVPAYVQDMIEVLEAALIDGAPGSRDTLDQLYDVLTAAIALKANTASPTFTGDPRSSDPPSGSNNTRIATTNWVRDRVAALVDSSPATLDTLNELAAALGDDPNFSATIMNLIGLRAPIASPTFTGNPRSVTPQAGDDSTRIATTAWIADFFGSASHRVFSTAGTHSYAWEWGASSGLFAFKNGPRPVLVRNPENDIYLPTADSWRGAVSDGTTLWFVNQTDGNATAYVAATQARDSAKDIANLVGSTESAAVSDGTTLWFVSRTFSTWGARAYVAATQARDSAKDIALPGGPYHSAVSDGTTLWFVENPDPDNTAQAYVAATQARDSAKDISLPGGPTGTDYGGSVSDGTTLWFILQGATSLVMARAYVAATQARDSAKDMTLDQDVHGGAASADGGTFWILDDSLNVVRSYDTHLPEIVGIGGNDYTNDVIVNGLSVNEAITINIPAGGTVIAAPLF